MRTSIGVSEVTLTATIIGTGPTSSAIVGSYSGSLSSVPEPGTLALFGQAARRRGHHRPAATSQATIPLTHGDSPEKYVGCPVEMAMTMKR